MCPTFCDPWTVTRQAPLTPGILSLRNRERIPHLEIGGGNGAPLDVFGTLVLPLEWRRVFRELLELQKGVKDPLEVPGVRCD